VEERIEVNSVNESEDGKPQRKSIIVSLPVINSGRENKNVR
jgi:hypothetical protein